MTMPRVNRGSQAAVLAYFSAVHEPSEYNQISRPVRDMAHRSPSARVSTGAVIRMVVASQISSEAVVLSRSPRTRS